MEWNHKSLRSMMPHCQTDMVASSGTKQVLYVICLEPVGLEPPSSQDVVALALPTQTIPFVVELWSRGMSHGSC